MDAKIIEMVDQVVNGYEKVKSLYKENEEVIKKLKAWVQENKVVIIITAIIVIGAGIFIYQKYQEVKQGVKVPGKKGKQEVDQASGKLDSETPE